MSSGSDTRLPLSRDAYYRPGFLSADEGWALFHEIRDSYDIRPGVVTMADGTEHPETHGKLMFVEPRLVEPDRFPLAHGRRVAWPPSIAGLAARVTALTDAPLEVVVALYYADGSVGNAFHSDLEAFGDTSRIASVSLGAARRFAIRRRAADTPELELTLEHGSLVFMGDGFQEVYEHAILADEAVTEPRINLTFRRFGW